MAGIKGLHMYGSSMNGLSLRGNSDVDMTLEYTGQEDSLKLLKQIRREFDRANSRDDASVPFYFEEISVFTASFGPTMSFKLYRKDIKGKQVPLEADILINKNLEIQNSNLIRTYGMCDARLVDLCLILKCWNKQMFPNKMNRLNSYSIVLMTIAYL